MNAPEFDFGEQLAMSSDFAAVADMKTILMQHIPGAVNVHAAATENDRQGVDWYVSKRLS